MNLSISEQLQNKVKGDFKLQRLDQNMNVIDTPVEDSNLVLNRAMEIIIDNLVDDSNYYPITIMKVGIDVGNGTQLDPEQPQLTYDEATMDVVYTSQQGNPITYNRNYTYEVTYNWIIFGYEVLALSEYQGKDSVEFTSAALHADDGRIFSYKRFPVVSISDIINISISWTIYYNV